MTLQLFNFNGSQIRTIEKGNEPWFVLKDVCEVLDLGQVAGVKRRLAEDVITNHPLLTPGGQQQVTLINEDGLYDVILESRKPEAKAFRKWVTSDVLPSIRKHGAYMTPTALVNALSNPEGMIQVLTRLQEEQTARVVAEARLIEQMPLVVFAQAVEVSKDTILIGELALLLRQNGIEIGQTRLFERLREEGYLHKVGSRKNLPTQKSVELGLMVIKEGTRSSVSEGTKITKTTKITGKGQTYFINKFKSFLSEAQ